MSFISLRNLSQQVSLLEVDFEHENPYLRIEDLEDLYQQIDDLAVNQTQILVVRQKGDQKTALYSIKLIYDSLNNVNQKLKALEYLQMLQIVALKIHKLGLILIQIFDGESDGSYKILGSNAQYRICSENARMEVKEGIQGISFLGGSSYCLNSVGKNYGFYMMLTGQQVDYQKMLKVDICNYFLESQKIDKFLEELVDCFDQYVDKEYLVINCINKLSNQLVFQSQDEFIDINFINYVFAKKTFKEILSVLDNQKNSNKFVVQTIQDIEKLNYRITQLCFRLMKKSNQNSFENILMQEFRVIQNLMDEENIFQGLKAYLHGKPIDWKQYQPQSILANEELQCYFKKLKMELDFNFVSRTKKHSDIIDHTLKNYQQNISIIDVSQPRQHHQSEFLSLIQKRSDQNIIEDLNSLDISVIDHEKINEMYVNAMSNIKQSQLDQVQYLDEVTNTIKQTVSRQLYILKNRFKFLLEQLRKSKVTLNLYQNKKQELDKQIDDDYILIELQNESEQFSRFQQKLTEKHSILEQNYSMLMEKILNQKHQIHEKKKVLNEINKENLKLIAQKKKLSQIVSSFQTHNHETISQIQLQSQEDIQLDIHNSMSQHIFENDEWMNIQKQVRSYQQQNQALKNSFIQQNRVFLESKRDFEQCWQYALSSLNRFQKISGSDGLQSSLLFTLQEQKLQKKQTQSQKFFKNLLNKNASSIPDQMTRNIVHGTLKNLINKQKNKKQDFENQNIDLIKNNFESYKFNQMIAILEINRKSLNSIFKIFYEKEKQIQDQFVQFNSVYKC